ncbi:unnamed protein product [Rangifer tarandus platyrhynchus]|uniref:Uncharacterized protein n=2 Tax=Rangifer tarandus platyrhynchus TaxID=3082113 RepID=A0ACB0FKU9_RANTA|nr:unnamed protein product [Rangifer tarandus platyrhynchus]CAI9713517.1 unnamed protein product [Rangifer tarandus platyrhynchus]
MAHTSWLGQRPDRLDSVFTWGSRDMGFSPGSAISQVQELHSQLPQPHEKSSLTFSGDTITKVPTGPRVFQTRAWQVTDRRTLGGDAQASCAKAFSFLMCFDSFIQQMLIEHPLSLSVLYQPNLQGLDGEPRGQEESNSVPPLDVWFDSRDICRLPKLSSVLYVLETT